MGNCSSSSFFSLPKRYLSSQLCKHFSLSLSFFPPYDMILLRLLIGTQHCRGSKLLKLNNGMVSVDDEGGTHEGKDHSGAESLRVHHQLRALRLHRHLEHEQQGTYT
jgi:hypothetical protein